MIGIEVRFPSSGSWAAMVGMSNLSHFRHAPCKDITLTVPSALAPAHADDTRASRSPRRRVRTTCGAGSRAYLGRAPDKALAGGPAHHQPPGRYRTAHVSPNAISGPEVLLLDTTLQRGYGTRSRSTLSLVVSAAEVRRRRRPKQLKHQTARQFATVTESVKSGPFGTATFISGRTPCGPSA